MKMVNISSKEKPDGLTVIQEVFLDTFEKTGNVKEALKESGMQKGNFNRDSVKGTDFGIKFRLAMNNALKKYDYSKLNSVQVLSDIIEKTKDEPDTMSIAISAIKEIAKMQDNHLAIQRKVEERRNVNVKAVIDFSKPKEETEDVEYLEI